MPNNHNILYHMYDYGYRPTSQGYNLLDSIRDPEIWKKTKQGAAAAGGFTLDLLQALATGFIKKQIKDKTGVEL